MPTVSRVVLLAVAAGALVGAAQDARADGPSNPNQTWNSDMLCAWEYDLEGVESVLYLENVGAETRHQFRWSVADLTSLDPPGGWSYSYDANTDQVVLTGTTDDLLAGENIRIVFTFDPNGKGLAYGTLGYEGGLTSGILQNIGVVVRFYRLDLTKNNDARGNVDVQPPPDDANDMRFAEGTELTLTAEPNEGKSFKKWKIHDPNDANDFVIDTNNPITILLDGDYEVKVFFKCGGGGIEGALPLLMVFAVLGLFALIRRKSE